MLRMLLDDMDPKNIIAEAELNDDGLYEVMISRDSTKALSVSVFPRVATNSLSQAVYLLHTSLGHMPKKALMALAKSVNEEQRDPETLSSMVMNWPSALTPEVIRDHFPQCKACALSFQKKTSIFESTWQ